MNGQILILGIVLTLAVPTRGIYCSLHEESWPLTETVLVLADLPSERPLSADDTHNCSFPAATNVRIESAFFNVTQLKTILQIVNMTTTNELSVELDNPLHLHSLSQQFLFGLDNLISLQIFMSSIYSVEAHAFIATPALRILALESSTMNNLSPDAFSGLAKLEILHLFSSNISELPPSIFYDLISLTSLDLDVKSSNLISILDENIFSRNIRIITLSIRNNSLHSLAPSMFKNLKVLRTLDLSHNSLSTLAGGIFESNNMLVSLNLYNNNLRNISVNLLEGLPDLEDLNLSYNHLKSIPENLLKLNPKLLNLAVTNNHLDYLPPELFRNSKKLEKLDLSMNALSVIPNKMFSSCVSLEQLELENNQITQIPSESLPLGNTSHLMYLGLSDNNISSQAFESSGDRKLSNLSFFNLASLSNLPDDIAVDLYGNKIETVIARGDRPNGTRVFLSGNPFKCDCHMFSFLNRYRNNDSFFISFEISDFDILKCETPLDLHFVDLSTVSLAALKCSAIAPDGECGPSGKCQCIFRPFLNALIVDCSGRFFESSDEITQLLSKDLRSLHNQGMPVGLLENFVHLDLRNSQLTATSLADVTNLPEHLQLLDLRGNRFQNLPAKFLEALNKANVMVDLRLNPWKCDCELISLYKFIQKNFSKVTSYDEVFCQDYDSPLMFLKESDFCLTLLRLSLFTVVPFVALTVVIIATVMLLRHKTAFYIWMYKHQMCIRFVKEAELDADKTYDAFISFAHQDEAFVMETLLRRLEHGDPRYRVCIHSRDWIPGELIETQIVNSIHDSRRTLIILSQNFIDSVWSRVEFRLAVEQGLQDRTNRVIVIVYGEIPTENQMDDHLLRYIKLHTYLDWRKTNFWDQLRYAMPHTR